MKNPKTKAFLALSTIAVFTSLLAAIYNDETNKTHAYQLTDPTSDVNYINKKFQALVEKNTPAEKKDIAIIVEPTPTKIIPTPTPTKKQAKHKSARATRSS